MKIHFGFAILYMIFIPDGFEIYKRNIEPTVLRIPLKKWAILILIILVSLFVEFIGILIRDLDISPFG